MVAVRFFSYPYSTIQLVRLLLSLLLTSVAWAQVPESPEFTRAKSDLEQLRALVAAGAAPRAQLERAEESLLDAQDASFLRRTLYGQELTEDVADEMIAATERRLKRREDAFDRAEELVKAGVATQSSLDSAREELNFAQKEHDLALIRAKLAHELAETARMEQQAERDLAQQAPNSSIAERYDGNGLFTPEEFQAINGAFLKKFAKPLPVSAFGETAVHRALGFDHRNRVDVAIHPDQPEGIWLRHFLTSQHVPYFAFRQAVPGKATNAHIHIGPMSGRIVRGG
jgi:hypothetical protein